MKLAGSDIFTRNKVYGMTYAAMTACNNDPLGSTPYAKFLAKLKAFDPDNFERFNLPSVAQSYDSVKLLFEAIEQTKSVDGDVLREWMYKNAASFQAVSGKMQNLSNATHHLFGVDALGFVDRPDVRRSDGTLPRAGC